MMKTCTIGFSAMLLWVCSSELSTAAVLSADHVRGARQPLQSHTWHPRQTYSNYTPLWGPQGPSPADVYRVTEVGSFEGVVGSLAENEPETLSTLFFEDSNGTVTLTLIDVTDIRRQYPYPPEIISGRSVSWYTFLWRASQTLEQEYPSTSSSAVSAEGSLAARKAASIQGQGGFTENGQPCTPQAIASRKTLVFYMKGDRIASYSVQSNPGFASFYDVNKDVSDDWDYTKTEVNFDLQVGWANDTGMTFTSVTLGDFFSNCSSFIAI